jgi:hypothetical protein
MSSSESLSILRCGLAVALVCLALPVSAGELPAPAVPAEGSSAQGAAPPNEAAEPRTQEQTEAPQQQSVLIPPPAPPPAAPQVPAAQRVVTEEDSPVSFKLPGVNTIVRFGGFAKLDVIYDFDSPQGDLIFVPGVPLEGSDEANRRGQMLLHARESRFALETRTASPHGEVKTYLEMDFFLTEGGELVSNSYRPRLRHLYGSVGPLLAGQTWSTFMDLPSLPENEDHEGPSGQNLLRQGLVRYTLELGSSNVLAFAIENPQSEFVERDGSTQNALDRWPDLVARWTTSHGWGHLSLRGVVREIRRNDGTGNVDAAAGYGFGIAGAFKPFGKDLIIYQFAGGNGIGRYILDVAGQAASFDDENLDLQASWGGFAGYQHWWTDTIRSTAVYSRTRIRNNTSVVPGNTNKETQSLHVNVFWNLTRQAEFGLEYIYGRRDTEDGSTGDFNRLQAGFRFSL